MRFLRSLLVCIVSINATNALAEEQKFQCSVSGRRDSHWTYSGTAMGDHKLDACQKALDQCRTAQASECLCGDCLQVAAYCHKQCRWTNGHESISICSEVCDYRPDLGDKL